MWKPEGRKLHYGTDEERGYNGQYFLCVMLENVYIAGTEVSQRDNYSNFDNLTQICIAPQ